ncbi:hypothetical protein LCGC14_2690350 [marine sediment metagenome]|uniref:Calcineurin-like phosphoesterase domain-containing protein n=1 Tax=marine sediment metagenome TaxID=412755 RepID=A0A0F9A673_9ZZZZ
MNSTIIKNHNNRVKPEDTVFFLGDFCFKNSPGGKEGEGEIHNAEYYLKQLNGRFVFIKGNHDGNNSLKTCIEYTLIHHGGKNIFLTHNPADYNWEYLWNFCGHVHEKWKFKEVKKSVIVNVGVDVWGYKPISYQEIMKEYHKWKKNRN